MAYRSNKINSLTLRLIVFKSKICILANYKIFKRCLNKRCQINKKCIYIYKIFGEKIKDLFKYWQQNHYVCQ